MASSSPLHANDLLPPTDPKWLSLAPVSSPTAAPAPAADAPKPQPNYLVLSSERFTRAVTAAKPAADAATIAGPVAVDAAAADPAAPAAVQGAAAGSGGNVPASTFLELSSPILEYAVDPIATEAAVPVGAVRKERRSSSTSTVGSGGERYLRLGSVSGGGNGDFTIVEE